MRHGLVIDDVHVGNLDRDPLRRGPADRRLAGSDALISHGGDQRLVHPVAGARAEFAAHLVEGVDCAGLGAGQFYRLGDDRRQHRVDIECRVDRLGHHAERTQFLDRATQLIGAFAQLV